MRAFVWANQAAAEDFGPAQYILGLCYVYGLGIDPAKAVATSWYEKAAKSTRLWLRSLPSATSAARERASRLTDAERGHGGFVPQGKAAGKLSTGLDSSVATGMCLRGTGSSSRATCIKLEHGLRERPRAGMVRRELRSKNSPSLGRAINYRELLPGMTLQEADKYLPSLCARVPSSMPAMLHLDASTLGLPNYFGERVSHIAIRLDENMRIETITVDVMLTSERLLRCSLNKAFGPPRVQSVQTLIWFGLDLSRLTWRKTEKALSLTFWNASSIVACG